MPPASFPVPAEREAPQDLSVAISEISDLQRRLVHQQQAAEKALHERDALRSKLEQCEVCPVGETSEQAFSVRSFLLGARLAWIPSSKDLLLHAGAEKE